MRCCWVAVGVLLFVAGLWLMRRTLGRERGMLLRMLRH